MPKEPGLHGRAVAEILNGGLTTTIDRAVAALLADGLIAFPTDTVYALAASLSRPAALERLYQVKRRQHDKPIPILLGAATDVATVAQDIDPRTARFLAACWPGQVTVILLAHDDLPNAVTGRDEHGHRTVAVRVPDHAFARFLIQRAGGAIAATSANESGRAPCLTASDVLRQLGPGLDLVVDGGPAPGGVASAIISLGVSGPEIIREGVIPAATLMDGWKMAGIQPNAS
ncbi:MAG: L-threonylcarbamoyladenylate synthase [Chloroflexota bacterium]|nr:L-threonylcarbamoyladenylate synthase [Chloroflexota bacterium]